MRIFLNILPFFNYYLYFSSDSLMIFSFLVILWKHRDLWGNTILDIHCHNFKNMAYIWESIATHMLLVLCNLLYIQKRTTYMRGISSRSNGNFLYIYNCKLFMEFWNVHILLIRRNVLVRRKLCQVFLFDFSLQL